MPRATRTRLVRDLSYALALGLASLVDRRLAARRERRRVRALHPAAA